MSYYGFFDIVNTRYSGRGSNRESEMKAKGDKWNISQSSKPKRAGTGSCVRNSTKLMFFKKQMRFSLVSSHGFRGCIPLIGGFI